MRLENEEALCIRWWSKVRSGNGLRVPVLILQHRRGWTASLDWAAATGIELRCPCRHCRRHRHLGSLLLAAERRCLLIPLSPPPFP